MVAIWAANSGKTSRLGQVSGVQEDGNGRDAIEVLVRVEVGLVVVENLHSGGSTAVMVAAGYRRFYGRSVPRGKKFHVRSVVAVTNFVLAKL